MFRKLSFSKVTNYLMFGTLSLFTAACLYFFSVTLISRMQGDNPSPVIPWTTLHIGFILIIVPLLGKKIFYKVVEAPEDVALGANAGIFVGLLRGLLYGGTVLVLGAVVLFCVDVERLLLDSNVPKAAYVILGISGCAGAFFYPTRVARKTRLWLLLTLICQFVMLSTIRQMLGLYPLKFRYSVESMQGASMPLLDPMIAEKLIPAGAENINVRGVRGGKNEVAMQCSISREKVDAFIKSHKYQLRGESRNGFSFGDNKRTLFNYNESRQELFGVFQDNGLPKALIHQKNDETSTPAPVAAPAAAPGATGAKER